MRIEDESVKRDGLRYLCLLEFGRNNKLRIRDVNTFSFPKLDRSWSFCFAASIGTLSHMILHRNPKSIFQRTFL